MVAEEHRRPLAVEDVGRRGGDLGQEWIEIDGHPEGAGDVQDLLEVGDVPVEVGDVPVEVGDAPVLIVADCHVISTAKR